VQSLQHHHEPGGDPRTVPRRQSLTLLLTRDIETSLQPGQSWSLDVKAGDRLLYRIGITSEEG
jgi:hypothetical protein